MHLNIISGTKQVTRYKYIQHIFLVQLFYQFFILNATIFVIARFFYLDELYYHIKIDHVFR